MIDKELELDIVFNELCFDFVPMEKVFYDANKGSLEISAELEDGSKATIYFNRVDGFSLESNDGFDMSSFCPNDFFVVTLYKVQDENIYIFPTEENVWKIYSSSSPVVN